MARILVFTPTFPKLNLAAGAQDQLHGALRLQRMGHSVRLAAFLPPHQAQTDARAYGDSIGLETATVPYPATAASFRTIAPRLLAAAAQPALLDGAAYQHAHPKVRQFVAAQLTSFRPDIVWLDNTFLWPIAPLAGKSGAAIIIRSQNFEPVHLIEESGRTLFNYGRAFVKYLGERAAVRHSSLLVSITPVEQDRYARLTRRREQIEMLPLRSLPALLRPPRLAVHTPLNVFYFGSSYNFSHNRAALEFTATQIWPRVRAAAPGEFHLHIFGGKVPAHIQRLEAGDLTIHGFVPDLELELDRMDLALVPSLYGCGMQQKIFEPLCRGFPVITSPRGLAGYPFEPGRHLLTAQTADEFAAQVLSLRDPQRRTELAQHASQRAAELFSEQAQIDAHRRIINKALAAR